MQTLISEVVLMAILLAVVVSAHLCAKKRSLSRSFQQGTAISVDGDPAPSA